MRNWNSYNASKFGSSADRFQMELFGLLHQASDKSIERFMEAKAPQMYRFVMALFIASLHKSHPLRAGTGKNMNMTPVPAIPEKGKKSSEGEEDEKDEEEEDEEEDETVEVVNDYESEERKSEKKKGQQKENKKRENGNESENEEDFEKDILNEWKELLITKEEHIESINDATLIHTASPNIPETMGFTDALFVDNKESHRTLTALSSMLLRTHACYFFFLIIIMLIIFLIEK
ncbi:hypothetical protein RFI_22098 [Reticulomyxa filosa]|uniref:Uncharacterized protein n=1 Tax=Reticulomyxa filosa TaxID=46433 RepID=X6MP91_RETFI|nr:hypothetical protein RFI_22098 [Reticulomyxa filosa]|eukprot:ETO15267.1 hypothetical protein RFI_22098 [Reticulomyxa filosa]